MSAGTEGARPAIAIDALVVAAFALSLFVVALTPWWTSDGVRDPAAFVAALEASRELVRPGDRVVVHPPWRDDVVAAIERARIVPDGVVVSTAFAPKHGARVPPLVIVRDVGAPGLSRALRAVLDEASARRTGDVEVVRAGGRS